VVTLALILIRRNVLEQIVVLLSTVMTAIVPLTGLATIGLFF
jgi:hypothetical protein